MKDYVNRKKGFTLLEILLVVAVIAILAAIVIIAINPTKKLAQLRNSERESNTRTLVDAFAQKSLDDGGAALAQITPLTYHMLGTDSSGCNINCGITGQTGTSTTNVALNQPASASSTYPFLAGYEADKANDGNLGNFWLNNYLLGTTNIWWQVDLGQQRTLNQVDIRWYNSAGTYNCNSLSFQGSNDGISFTTVSGPIDTSSDPTNSSYNFSPSSYRYWRLACGQGTNGNFWVLREVSMFESTQVPATTEPTCLDLGPDIVPDYVVGIPIDPSVGTPGNTGYAMFFTPDGRIEGRACHAELNEEIMLKK